MKEEDRELISAYFDGECTEEEKARVDKLLESDADAQKFADELLQLRQLLTDLPKESAPDNFNIKFGRALDKAVKAAEDAKVIPLRVYMKYAGVAAAVLFFLIGGVVIQQHFRDLQEQGGEGYVAYNSATSLGEASHSPAYDLDAKEGSYYLDNPVNEDSAEEALSSRRTDPLRSTTETISKARGSSSSEDDAERVRNDSGMILAPERNYNLQSHLGAQGGDAPVVVSAAEFNARPYLKANQLNMVDLRVADDTDLVSQNILDMVTKNPALKGVKVYPSPLTTGFSQNGYQRLSLDKTSQWSAGEAKGSSSKSEVKSDRNSRVKGASNEVKRESAATGTDASKDASVNRVAANSQPDSANALRDDRENAASTDYIVLELDADQLASLQATLSQASTLENTKVMPQVSLEYVSAEPSFTSSTWTRSASQPADTNAYLQMLEELQSATASSLAKRSMTKSAESKEKARDERYNEESEEEIATTSSIRSGKAGEDNASQRAEDLDRAIKALKESQSSARPDREAVNEKEVSKKSPSEPSKPQEMDQAENRGLNREGDGATAKSNFGGGSGEPRDGSDDKAADVESRAKSEGVKSELEKLDRDEEEGAAPAEAKQAKSDEKPKRVRVYLRVLKRE